MNPPPKAFELFVQGYQKILEGLDELGYHTATDPNFAGTAERAAKGLSELIRGESAIEKRIDELLTKTFPARYQEMVISKYNIAFGVCPHHLLPVIYRISVAYIPRDRVLGISKLSRLAQLMARGAVLQEEMTHNLCSLLHDRLASEGAAVYVEGLHLCMASRGVQAHEARVVTSAMRGVFLDQLATRQEFLRLVTASHPNLV